MTSNFFLPAAQVITNITQANPAVVTTSTSNNYNNGLYVRFVFPAYFGMTLLNEQVYQITVLSPTTFSIPVNTTNFDPFTLAVTTQSPQVIPVGEIASTLANAVKNNDNIVPES